MEISLRSNRVIDSSVLRDLVVASVFASMPEGDLNDILPAYTEQLAPITIEMSDVEDIVAFITPLAQKVRRDVYTWYASTMLSKLLAYKWPRRIPQF